MGNRANYILIENGQAQIFFSRWGALTIPSVLLSGPEATLAYIRQLTPMETLMDNIWAEGGVFLDVDTYRVLFWGGDTIAIRPYLRRPLLAALPLLWPEWSIKWAMFGVADMAQSIGGDVSQVLKNEFDDTAFLTGSGPVATEAQLLKSLKVDGPGTLLTIRWHSGEVRDYLFFANEHLHERFNKRGKNYFFATPYQVLSLGPRLMSMLHTQPTALLAREGSEQEPLKGAYVNEEAHTIWVWEYETIDPRYLEALARRWPGWQVHGHVEGLVRHVALSGRDSAAYSISKQQAIQELVSELIRDQGINPMQIAQVVQQALPTEDQQEMKFGMGFFSADAPPLTSQERQEVLSRLFEGIM